MTDKQTSARVSTIAGKLMAEHSQHPTPFREPERRGKLIEAMLATDTNGEAADEVAERLLDAMEPVLASFFEDVFSLAASALSQDETAGQ